MASIPKHLSEDFLQVPHHHLGPHQGVLRLYIPESSQIRLEIRGQILPVDSSDSLVEIPYCGELAPGHYRIDRGDGKFRHDPYAFSPIWGSLDEALFEQGKHYRIYEKMGANTTFHQGVKGVHFAVWAPHAQAVSVIGDFNNWDGRTHPMRLMPGCGVWELFLPDIGAGVRYQFEIKTSTGSTLRKSDPYGKQFEKRPSNFSIVTDPEHFAFTDGEWQNAKQPIKGRPLNIYEVHLGSWKRNGGDFINYRELAHDLADYVKAMGYTHVELMPLLEHPLDESWGYQVTGFYAPTSRHGGIEDFQYFVNFMHGHQIGVILDWVPAHFPTDHYGLAHFDGSHLYEYEDPQLGFHPHWNTHIFDFRSPQVVNFLLGSALYFLKTFHADGLRVDAVASMIHLDYGRQSGEWTPNIYGGKENLEAIAFIRQLNQIVHQECPHTIMCAEDSSPKPDVTVPVAQGGLGFDLKWNMGWMNDTLSFFKTGMDHRTHRIGALKFTFFYLFKEDFLLPLSHDEVVHEKGSLIGKMPGNDQERFSNLRLLYAYKMTYPGKKLLFMGGELAQFCEWGCGDQLHWHLLELVQNDQLSRYTKRLNHFYLNNPSLWENDGDATAFEWIEPNSYTDGSIAFIRRGKNSKLLCIHNFLNRDLFDYVAKVPRAHWLELRFNSDLTEYGGRGGVVEPLLSSDDQMFRFFLPALTTLIYEVRSETYHPELLSQIDRRDQSSQ